METVPQKLSMEVFIKFIRVISREDLLIYISKEKSKLRKSFAEGLFISRFHTDPRQPQLKLF